MEEAFLASSDKMQYCRRFAIALPDERDLVWIATKGLNVGLRPAKRCIIMVKPGIEIAKRRVIELMVLQEAKSSRRLYTPTATTSGNWWTQLSNGQLAGSS